MSTAHFSSSPRRAAFWRPLQSVTRLAATLLGRRDDQGKDKQQPACGLGIDWLPDGLGQLYSDTPVALLVHDTANQYIWLRALLTDALATGPVVLLAGEQDWVDGLLEYAPLQTALAQGQLTLLLMSPQMPVQVKRHGMAPVFSELKNLRLPPTHALFVMGSHLWLLDQTVAELCRQAAELDRWCAKRQRPVVFGFLNPVNTDELLTRLRNFFGLFHHIAMLDRINGRPTLLLERWSCPKGAVFQSRFGLKQDTLTSRLVYDGSRTCGLAQQLVEAPDQYQVIATEAAVAAQRGIPGHWQIVAHTGDIVAAAEHSIGATLLLHSGAADDFETLARLIHGLRMTHPRTLKIVIRETLGKLRANKEQALLRLGANIVVYREVGFSRLLQLLQDINEQSYSKESYPDYESAMASFMPDTLSGYQPPEKFCTAVQAMLGRTTGIGLKHTLVRLPMLPAVAHVDALRACAMLRAGDLLTTDQDSLVVFLFSCRAPDVDQALSRLFQLPLDQFFSSQVSDSSDEGIRSMLNRLQDAARQGLPDYSLYLEPPAGDESIATVTRRAEVDPVDATHLLSAVAPPSALAERIISDAPVAPTMQPKAIARKSPPQSPKGNTA